MRARLRFFCASSESFDGVQQSHEQHYHQRGDAGGFVELSLDASGRDRLQLYRPRDGVEHQAVDLFAIVQRRSDFQLVELDADRQSRRDRRKRKPQDRNKVQRGHRRRLPLGRSEIVRRCGMPPNISSNPLYHASGY